VNTHSQIQHRTGLPVSNAGGGPQRRSRALDPAVLACILLAAILAVLIANSVASSGADRLGIGHAAIRRVSPVNLPGGVQGNQKRGVIHAPYGYSPPGIWKGPNGPVVQ
jgi:hypothetical protein